VVKYDLF